MKIPVVRQDPTHPLPAFAHAGDAGADLTASEATMIPSGAWTVVGTGISMAIPSGHAGFVLPRSGLAARSGVTVLNAPGLVDSGYRGEFRVALINHGPEDFEIAFGDRIAQLVIVAIERPDYAAVESLEDTTRGSGGFGSTGVRGD